MATHDTESQKTGTVKRVAFAILGLAGLAGMDQIASELVCVFGIPLKTALETLPTIILTAWHILQPGTFGYLRLLAGLVQVSGSWQFALTLIGARSYVVGRWRLPKTKGIFWKFHVDLTGSHSTLK